MPYADAKFEIRGINHVALVCSDMHRTIRFYTEVLGLPLVKTLELPGGSGHHFFFGLSNGDCIAFFHFPSAPGPVPGVAAPRGFPGSPELYSAVGSMNHLAFDVPPEQVEAYRERLQAMGVECSVVTNHDDSAKTVSRELHPGVFMRSLYFFDPDGVLLEFSCWTNDRVDVRAAAASTQA